MSRRSKRDAILTLREGAFFYAAGSATFVNLHLLRSCKSLGASCGDLRVALHFRGSDGRRAAFALSATRCASMSRLLIALIYCQLGLSLSLALGGPSPRMRAAFSLSRAAAPLLADSSEDEIAELEAQLAKLRSKQAAEIEEELPPEFGEKTMEVPEFDELTLSYRKRVAAIQEAPPAEFLSEAWKEQEAGGGGISLPLPAIGAAVALLIFALIPFGDGGESYRDRDKGVESPAQIRARYQDAGYADGDYSQAAADAVDE